MVNIGTFMCVLSISYNIIRKYLIKLFMFFVNFFLKIVNLNYSYFFYYIVVYIIIIKILK